jgi:hypothetical protein
MLLCLFLRAQKAEWRVLTLFPLGCSGEEHTKRQSAASIAYVNPLTFRKQFLVFSALSAFLLVLVRLGIVWITSRPST